MSREARKISSTGTYTVILRAKTSFINQEVRNIFYDVLLKYKQSEQFEIYSYAIDSKTIYLVIKEGSAGIGSHIKKITLSFVYKLKTKFSRLTSVFHGRYLSEPLETTEQIIDAIVNVNLLYKNEFDTCFNTYFKNELINSEFVLNTLGKRKFVKLHKSLRKTGSNKIIAVGKLSDKEMSDFIYNKYGIKVSEINKIKKGKLERLLLEIVKHTKASARQISRITKISLRYLWNLFKVKKEAQCAKN